MSKPSLILASTSVYRKALLEKLTPHFQTAKPDVDETPLAGETPQQLVERLAVLKAKAIAAQQPNAVVIGSDQVAVFQNDILGKPHTVDKAIAQLSRFSGHTVTFLTGLAVVNSSTGQTQVLTDAFHVSFRELTLQEIQRYVEREMPLNCAGSFKSEGLGITLFSKLDGEDPNSLIGLPLIKLYQLLKNTGLDLLLEP